MPAIRPMKNAPTTSTLAQPAVIATSPASEPFSVIETSGFLFFIHVNTIVEMVPVAAATVVVTSTCES